MARVHGTSRSAKPGNPPRIDQTGVADRLARLADAQIRFTSRLCAIDTTNPPGRNYLACCELLQEKMESLGLKTRLLRVPPAEQARLAPGLDDHPRYCIVGRWDVGAGKTLHLTGHYDVVPATAGWKTDPFKPVVRGGKLIARGAGDMKGSNAAALFAVQAIRQAGATPRWNIELSFTPDEETGGYAGLGWLVRRGHVRADAAILCEGGGSGKVCYAHRGVLWAEVTVIGKPGHACNPRGGTNALEHAIPLIQRFKKLEKVYATRRTAFNIAAKSPTLMIGGVCRGGGKHNTIPDRFCFSIDRRLNPEDDPADVKAELLEVVRQARRADRKLRVEVAWPLFVPPGWTTADQPIARMALAVAGQLSGKPARLRMTAGFTDLHFLTADGGIPAIGYGADGSGAHSDFECVKLSELAHAARFYAEMMLRME